MAEAEEFRRPTGAKAEEAGFQMVEWSCSRTTEAEKECERVGRAVMGLD